MSRITACCLIFLLGSWYIDNYGWIFENIDIIFTLVTEDKDILVEICANKLMYSTMKIVCKSLVQHAQVVV